MKKIWQGALIGTLALAGSAWGAVYTDAATNYPGGSWTNGSNGGTGFGPWSIVADSQGGWAGAGIWDSAGAGLMMGEAFGYVGKVGYVDIDRNFSQALNINDTFEFDFGVNWDSNGGNKGFNLYANGIQVINVNHGNFPGHLTLNGSPALTNYGTNTMHWTFTQVAPNQIAVQASGRDGVETFATTVTTASAYGYIGALRFYSSGLEASAPDQRQSYFNNLQLTQEGTPPPPPMTLSFSAGVWNPPIPGNYEFELTRTGAVGEEIALNSGNEAAVTVPPTVTFASLEDSTVIFTATVVSVTNGDATLFATNLSSGARDEYTIRAPGLSIDGPWEVYAAGPVNYTLTRVAGIGATVNLQSTNPAVMTVPLTAMFAEGEDTTSFQATAIGEGATTLTATDPVNGVKAEFNVTFSAPTLVLTGPTTAQVGDTNTYTLTRNGPIGDDVNLSSDDPGVMTVPPTVSFPFDENTVTFQATALAAGSAVLQASNDDATSNPLEVTVTEPAEYDAYDDASLYAGGAWTPTPAHVTGFSNWTETLSPDQAGSYRGVFIGASAITAVNQNGLAFGLYANYDDPAPDPLPEVKVSRFFPAPMATGQVFSVDVGYDYSGGSKGLKLFGQFEGAAYERFALFNSGSDTWSVKFDNNDATIQQVWSGYIAGGFKARVQVTCTAPNTFTFSLQRDGEAAVVIPDVVLPGEIDQVEFYNYNGGKGDPENFYFNRMWLSKTLGPEPGPEIVNIIYNPTTDELKFTVPDGYTLLRVEGADCGLVDGDFDWQPLVLNTDYTVNGSEVTILTDTAMRQIIRIVLE